MHVPFSRAQFHFTTLFILIGLLCLAFGCRAVPGLPNAPATPTSTSGGSKTTLTLWHTLTGDKRTALEKMTAAFTAVYPDLNVNAVYVGSDDDLTKQMTAALAMGTAPDLVLADRRQLAEFARQDGLLPLEPFLNDTQLGLGKDDRADFVNGMLNLGKFPTLGNKTYGFPFDQEALVLFYNSDALQQANITGAPTTWDEFVQDTAPLTHDQFYAWAMRPDAATFEAMLASRGSALLTDDETTALFNQRAGLASLKMVADLAEGGAAELATSDDNARTAFASGQAAFYMGWMSELPILKQAQRQAKQTFEIGVAPLPQLDASSPWLLTRGDLFGITRESSDKARNAWFFIRWITAPTQSANWVRATDAIPLRDSALTLIAPDLPTNALFRQIAKAFDGVIPSLAPQPAYVHMDTVEEQVSGLWLQAIQPKADLAAILDALATRINQMLATQS